MKSIRWLPLLFAAALFAFVGCEGPTGPAGANGADGIDFNSTVADESCILCHSDGAIVDIDVATGTHAPTALVAANRLIVTVDSVTYDTTTTPASLKTAFHVTDEALVPVTGIVASGVRVGVAYLDPATAGGTDEWFSLTPSTTSGSASTQTPGTTSGGVFAEVGGGAYTFVLGDNAGALYNWAPLATSLRPFRVALQVEKGTTADTVKNGWFNFIPSNMTANVAYTTDDGNPREIVTTDTCAACHDADNAGDRLYMHGGGNRRDVEYCVMCHTPTRDEFDFKRMVHRVHMGKNLPSVQAGATVVAGETGFAKGGFPQPVTNCQKCHDPTTTTAPLDNNRWNQNPTQEACGSCHDLVTFDGTAGVNMAGDPFTHLTRANGTCDGCHAPSGVAATDDADPIVITTAHRTAAIKTEADKYSYVISSATYDSATGNLTVVFYAQDNTLTKLNLSTHTIFTTSGASLNMKVGWKGVGEADYTNPGAGGSDPASPINLALVTGDPPAYKSSITLASGTATITEASGVYTAVIPLPAGAKAAGTGIVFLDGHPAKEVKAGSGLKDRLPVKNTIKEFPINDTSGGFAPSPAADPRRTVVAATMTKCDACHDQVSLHGNNRQGDIRVCTTCHNSANTDLAVRPASGAVDGKAEETIDFKRMIHRIHAGRDTTTGEVVIYGFRGSINRFAGEFPRGTPLNACEVCHETDTYKPMPDGIQGSTIDSGLLADQSDDLNISPITAVCSSCHDGELATGHIRQMGGNWSVLEANTNYTHGD